MWKRFHRNSLGRRARSICSVFACGILSVALSTTPASADAYCSGLTTTALSYSNGDVMVLPVWRGDWLKLCNLNTTRNSVTPQTCFAWFSTINSSILYNKEVGYYFGGMDPTGCATVATYDGTPAPVYVRLTK
jgi:hypothetical protein